MHKLKFKQIYFANISMGIHQMERMETKKTWLQNINLSMQQQKNNMEE